MHSSIRIYGGKTQVWNGAGVKPAICEVQDRVVQAADPEAKVWEGSKVPPNKQGLKILGAPFGHQEFVSAQLEKKLQKQETLIRRIPLVPDLQSAWLILLHCAVPGQIICSEWLTLSRCSNSHRLKMRDCGNVSASSWESHSTCAMPRGAQQVCLQSLEDWV